MLRATVLAAIIAAATFARAADNFVTIRGAQLVGQAITDAAAAMKEAVGVEYHFVGDSSPGAIHSVGEGIVDIALSTRALRPDERAHWPSKRFTETLIGKQAVVFVVPKQVWEGGIRALTKAQLRQIYEGEVTNWKALGGPDRKIEFFNRDVGKGIWDLAMIFLYNDVRRAPLSKAVTLTNAQEVITTVEFNGNSISILEYGAYTPSEYVHALGIKQPDGTVIEPTLANIASGKYEVSRPLLLIASKQPTGKVRDFIEFMQGKKGQEFVKKAFHVPVADLSKE